MNASSSSPTILTIDQGTTSSRALIYDCHARKIISLAQREFAQHYPESGWVEHEGEDLWTSTLAVMREAMEQADIDPDKPGTGVHGIGITNQRETTAIWERDTGKLIHRAIVWQDRRTAEDCALLARDTAAVTALTEKTGLPLDPYFCATKIAWILDRVPGARKRAEAGELLFGTIDSFLIWRLTAGAPYTPSRAVHRTDITNASRTNLFNIHTRAWDESLTKFFNVPAKMLPEVRPSSGLFAHVSPGLPGAGLPVLGVGGDQQASLFGHGCTKEGMMKSTYGTGAFLLVHTGARALPSKNNLLTTCACTLSEDDPAYAMEGAIFIAGAALKWLKENLALLRDYQETGPIAAALDASGGSHGVVVVPSFSGLGAPYWNPHARGAIYGLSRGTTREDIIRATLESLAFQTSDLTTALIDDGIRPTELRVDGGVAANDWLMGFMSTMLNIPILRPASLECTALGAMALAAIAAGIWETPEEIQHGDPSVHRFTPAEHFTSTERKATLNRWRRAVRATEVFAKSDA